jgi:hypothetical protein
MFYTPDPPDDEGAWDQHQEEEQALNEAGE